MSPNDILPHKSACGPEIFISGNASSIHPISQARNPEGGYDCLSLSLISHTQTVFWSLGIYSQLLLQLSDRGEWLNQFTLLWLQYGDRSHPLKIGLHLSEISGPEVTIHERWDAEDGDTDRAHE